MFVWTEGRLVRRPAALTLAILLCLAGPAAAQQPDELRILKQEIEALKQEQAKLRGEMQTLKQLLQRSRGPTTEPPPQNVSLSLGNDPTKGDRNARLVLVEFSDYQ